MDRIDDKQGEHTTGLIGEATLGGVPGLGILDVVRSADGDVTETLGTWRLKDEGAGQDVSELHRAHETGEGLRYAGRLHDDKHPGRDRVELEVRIVDIDSYLYSESEYEDNETERTLYKFRPVASLPYAD